MDEDEDEYVPPESITEETAETRTSRPGQKGFAARLMAKYGWAKGQGLGSDAGGILQPLRVQVEKRKKKSDAEGGGWAEPGGRARIIGSKTGTGTQSESSGGKFGPMSSVVVLRDMLEGMEDLQGEMESGLGQEIGEECGDKYGRVERLHIDIQGRRVYIKFTDQVSALRVSFSSISVWWWWWLVIEGQVRSGHANYIIGSQCPGRPHICRQHHPAPVLRRRQVRAKGLRVTDGGTCQDT